MSSKAAAGAVSRKSMNVYVPFGARTSMNPPPPRPEWYIPITPAEDCSYWEGVSVMFRDDIVLEGCNLARIGCIGIMIALSNVFPLLKGSHI
jgi:hypothetical protein